jgi:hypothetical protein
MEKQKKTWEKQEDYLGIPLNKEGVLEWPVRADDLNKGMLAQIEILKGLMPSTEGDKVMASFVQYLHEIAVRQLILLNIAEGDTVRQLLKENQDGRFFKDFKKAALAAT